MAFDKGYSDSRGRLHGRNVFRSLLNSMQVFESLSESLVLDQLRGVGMA
jgi:hypothetical protein